MKRTLKNIVCMGACLRGHEKIVFRVLAGMLFALVVSYGWFINQTVTTVAQTKTIQERIAAEGIRLTEASAGLAAARELLDERSITSFGFHEVADRDIVFVERNTQTGLSFHDQGR